MGLDLVNYEHKASVAVKAFWGNRDAAKRKQIELGEAIKVKELVLPQAKIWMVF